MSYLANNCPIYITNIACIFSVVIGPRKMNTVISNFKGQKDVSRKVTNNVRIGNSLVINKREGAK